MKVETAVQSMILTATGHGGHHYDDETLRAWYCDDSDAGRWLVIGGRDLGLAIGDTREEALADAARCCGEPVEECDSDDEKRVEVIQIRGTPVEDLNDALESAVNHSRQQDAIVRVDVCDIEAATEILDVLADEAGEEIGYVDTRHGTIREVWGAVEADRSVWRLELHLI